MKKVLSIVLAAILVCGMATVAFAAGAPKIDTKINYGFSDWVGQDYEYEGLKGDTPDGTASEGYIHMGETRPDTRILLRLGVDSFHWEDGNEPSKVTTSQLNATGVKITVKKKVSKGSNVLDSVELKTNTNTRGGLHVRVKFIEEYVSTGEQDFDITVYLAKSSTKIDNSEVVITGTLKNLKVEVDEDDEEVDLSEGQYAEAEGYVKAVQVDTGNGLFVNTKMFDGKKYYAKSSQDPSAADDKVLAQYPEIDTIYYLNTVNMASAGNTVEFDIDDTYYVYDANGKYIGTTNDLLPMSSKYYLAIEQITMNMNGGSDSSASEEPADEDPAGEEPDDEEIYNPGTGGDDVPANANDNPGTGANGFVNVAAIAGVVALAAAVSLKK